MDELMRLDSDFSEAKFKTNVDNIFVKLHMAVMLKDLERVRHFLSDELYQKYFNVIQELEEKNLIHMYDEFNVASTEIMNVEITEEYFLIYVMIRSKCMDYYIDKDTKKYVSGNNVRREERNHILTFMKKRNHNIQGNARRCPSCGANIDVNHDGKCSYCGTIYNLKDYEYVLTDIK